MGIFPTGDNPRVLLRAAQIGSRQGGKLSLAGFQQARKEFAAFERIQEFGALRKARRDFPKFRKGQTFGLFTRRIDRRVNRGTPGLRA